MRALVTIFVVLAIATGAARADDKERARELHERGLRHYKVGDYAEAIRYYKEAYKAFPAAGILFNLAQAYRQHGDCADAVQTYRNYVAEVPTGPNADIARGFITSLHCAEPAPDPVPYAGGSKPDPVAVTTTAPPRDDRGKTLRLAGLIAGGVGVLALGVSVTFGLEARSTSAEVEDFFAAGGTWSEELADKEATGQGQERASIAFAVVAGSAIAAGAAMYFGGRALSNRESRVSAAPVRGGAVVGLSGSF